MKPTIAIIRGTFLNRYEMQFFEPLVHDFRITAFGSLTPFHDQFSFPVVKLASPMDLPDFPYKMQILNRMFIDAHYLWGLEEKLQGFDVVHTAETYYHFTRQALNAKKKGYVKKVIATVLENIPFNNEGIWGRKSFKARARNELDHIIALTNKTRDALITEGADPKKITVIPHFVDTKRFSSHDVKDSKNLTILFVGRLEEEKGVLDLIEAIKILSRDEALQKYILHFIFCGKGSIKVNLFDGHVRVREANYDEMPEVYRNADIFVAPSKARIAHGRLTWEEQYNTALLEAQASGLPIVTTNSGGISENVGKAAVIVPPGSIPMIAEAIKQFILNPKLRDAYGKMARERAQKVHDISIGANTLKHLYQAILKS